MAESSPGGLRSPWRLTPASSKRTSGNRPPSYERAGRVPGKGGGARGRGRVRHRPPRPAGCEPRRPAGAGHRGAGTQRGGKVDGATGALRPPPARPGHRPPGRRGHHRRPAAPPPPTRHRLPPAGAVGVPGAHRAREPGARGLDLRGRPGEAPAGPRRHLRPLPAARRLEADPRVLLVDEPGAGLAPGIATQVYEELAALCREGRTVLLVDQNVQAALALANYVYTLESGRNQLSGTPADFDVASLVRGWLRVPAGPGGAP